MNNNIDVISSAQFIISCINKICVPSTSQSVSKKPALLLHSVHDSSIEIPVILSEAIPSSDYDIHNIRPISKSGFVITLNSEDDTIKLSTAIQKIPDISSKVTIKNPGKRHLSMILYNVPSNISDEEIQSHLQTNKCPLKIRFQFKGRLTNTRNLVFETPAAEFHKLKNIKKVPIKCIILVNFTTSSAATSVSPSDIQRRTADTTSLHVLIVPDTTELKNVPLITIFV
ncbi:hypothetical protein AVEN_145970-1 [Araneus ventricosus]|uniref:Uncharacterized protein n=1 Tax=Araneus ventricosus TaxID=182803 RepID=A0A4Y2IW37_ARAVE|nr:hypothetical protein AVEN_145970-1 [Araneus ventricosus]